MTLILVVIWQNKNHFGPGYCWDVSGPGHHALRPFTHRPEATRSRHRLVNLRLSKFDGQFPSVLLKLRKSLARFGSRFIFSRKLMPVWYKIQEECRPRFGSITDASKLTWATYFFLYSLTGFIFTTFKIFWLSSGNWITTNQGPLLLTWINFYPSLDM